MATLTIDFCLATADGLYLCTADGQRIVLYSAGIVFDDCALANLLPLDTTANLLEIDATANLLEVDTTTNLLELDTTANLLELDTTANLECD